MEIVPLPAALGAHARTLLAANDLPTDDLADPAITLLAALDGSARDGSARDGSALLGVIGLQTSGELGLLRSLAVEPSARSRGIGRALCARVVELARDRGLGSLWLLTSSAGEYFTHLGFETVDRAHAPPALRATAQFASLCPASAVVMRRSALS